MQETENPKCKKYFEKFLALDKNEIIPFRVSLHLLFCAKCRTAVRSMSIAEKLLQHEMDENTPHRTQPRELEGRQAERNAGQGDEPKAAARNPVRDPIVEAALRQIAKAGLAYPQMPVPGRVSLRKWIAGGIILVLCLAAFPFTAMGKWAAAVLGVRFLVSFYAVMGLAVAAYTVIFIGSNLDFFVKRIEAVKKTLPEKLKR